MSPFCSITAARGASLLLCREPKIAPLLDWRYHGPQGIDRNALRRLLREALQLPEKTEAQQVRKVRDYAIIVLLAETGIRVSELVSLTPDDVILRDRRKWLRIRGKGRKERMVPLTSQARAALERWLEVREGWMAGHPQEASPTVFGLKERRVRQRLQRLANRAEVEGVHPHTLRHTFARTLLSEGANLVDVAALLGHSSLQTTQRYTQPSERDLARTVDLLEIS